MLKTNSKQFLINLDSYILRNAQVIAHEYEEQVPATAKAAYTMLNTTFFKEYLKHNKCFKAGKVNKYELFKQWAQGLAFGGTFDYYLHNAVNTLGDMLEQTETEKNKYTEDQSAERLTQLIYNRMIKKA